MSYQVIDDSINGTKDLLVEVIVVLFSYQWFYVYDGIQIRIISTKSYSPMEDS